jgi:hypothetical protein
LTCQALVHRALFSSGDELGNCLDVATPIEIQRDLVTQNLVPPLLQPRPLRSQPMPGQPSQRLAPEQLERAGVITWLSRSLHRLLEPFHIHGVRRQS